MVLEENEEYLKILMKLISIRSVFSDQNKAKAAASFCKNYLQDVLPNWTTYQDRAGNVICFNPNEASPYRIFFSAHLDTVGARPEEWKTSGNPFEAIRTDTHIIGRGANDCKAGVAFALYTAYLISKKKLEFSNYIFVLSYREEGNLWKTACFAAANIGKQIPVGAKNALICLENTVSISEEGSNPFLITAYDSEPCNYFVSIKGSLEKLGNFLISNADWAPVFIRPLSQIQSTGDTMIRLGLGGHSATIQNSNNAIHNMLTSCGLTSVALWSGDRTQLSTVPAQAHYCEISEKIDHEVIINLRSNTDTNQVRQQLNGLNFSEETPFKLAYGSYRSDHEPTKSILDICHHSVFEGLRSKRSSNPGRSDASAYWKHIHPDVKERMGIIVMGPGTRSHTLSDGIVRKTHGVDESFHIESGIKAMNFIHECTFTMNHAW